MNEHTNERLARLLALITYLQEHPGVPVAAVAEHFGVSEARVIDDVNTLWVSGTPGYFHADLIDFSADEFDRGVLTLTDSRKMSTPLRLGGTEAVSLLVALRSLEAVVGSTELIAATADKLRTAAGDAARVEDAVHIAAPATGAAATLRADLARAIADDRRVHLRYVSAADEVSERDVDPLVVLTDGSRWYLYAWCHRADAPRQFRLDRISAATVLTSARAAHPELAAPAGPAPEAGPGTASVRIRLAGQARWVAEQVPHDGLSDEADGSFTIEVPVIDPAWLRRLCLELGPLVLGLEGAEAGDLAAGVTQGAHAALAAYELLGPGSVTVGPAI